MITPSFSLTATERVLPKLALDFTTASLDPRITFTRTTDATHPATYTDSSGSLINATDNQPRFDYNSTTLTCNGLLIEESRTNSIRNNTMQGASSPSTLPTNWNTGSLTSNGVTCSINGTGVENGISFIDLTFAGTSTGVASFPIGFEPNTQVAASQGQSWTGSVYTKLQAGSSIGFSGTLLILRERSGAGSTLETTTGNFSIGALSLIKQRSNVSRTFTNASTAFVSFQIQPSFDSGISVNCTLRIGLPQLEQGAFATSVIPTTTTALTRNADVATMTGTNFSSWYNASEGTFVVGSSTYYPSSYKAIIQADDGATNNRIYVDINSGTARSVSTVSGSNQCLINLSSPVANTPFTIASAFKLNNCAASMNASSVGTDTSATMPTVVQLRFGSDSVTFYNGHIQKLNYYVQRLTNSEIQSFSK